MKWSDYNQSLVRRGEIPIGFDVINNWDTELKEMNKDKVGEPFHYPQYFSSSTRIFQGILSFAIQINWGITQRHIHGKVPSIPDSSQ